MKLLVTGATGNVGGCLTRRLAALGHEVTVLVRARSDRGPLAGVAGLREALGDLTDPGALAAAVRGQEAVFHVAGVVSYWRGDRDRQYQGTVIGTRNVVAACLAAGVRRLVHTSSAAAIGMPHPGDRPIDESWALDDDARAVAYFRTKWEAEQEVWAGVARGLDATVVNPGVIWGAEAPKLNSNRVLRRVAEGRLPAYVPGGVTVVDMADVVEGHLLALEKGRRGERYILAAECLPWRAVFEQISVLVGRPAPTRAIPRWLLLGAGFLADYWGLWVTGRAPEVTLDIGRCAGRMLYYDGAKARRELGFAPRPFDETLRRTLAGLGY
ncbi:MAG: NAD-dependent epimerase/dehydratase family protein, partial [Planctomycetes bacterium]|nr:NAD-dependent epimerase/dehydratase family protein [Planctomycetota bacterium]